MLNKIISLIKRCLGIKKKQCKRVVYHPNCRCTITPYFDEKKG